ncbi:MAG: helical backbone metal receptor [bacterium]
MNLPARWLPAFLPVLLLAAGCHRAAPPPPPAATPAAPRIVSLAPNLTEIICAVGGAGQLVGRTDVCNHPANLLTNVPVVGGFGRPFLEPLLLQNPTVVLEADLEDKSLGATLERLRIDRRHIECRRLADIPRAVRIIGRLAGRLDAGNTLAASLEFGIRARREAISRVPQEQRPLVYVELWGDPLMTVGRTSFVSELVALAGGRNLGDELANDYGVISTEWVLTRNPEIILCLYMDKDHRARKTVMSRLGWKTTRAVQRGRVYDAFDIDTILRPGPRVLDGVEQLRRVIAEPEAGNRKTEGG